MKGRRQMKCLIRGGEGRVGETKRTKCRVGETKRVKDRVEVLKRTKCRVRGRSRGATKQARCCAQGLVAGGASVEALACMQKNRGRLMVSKKNRYRTLKRRLFV